MNKFVIVSDSFKGTLSSKEITEIFYNTCKEIFPDSDVIKVPIADGGEGMLDFIEYTLKGKLINVETVNPYFEKIYSDIFISDDNIAYIESAKAIGINLINKLDPSATTSYGVGLLIKEAIERGCKKIVLGLGGSCTNDAGCGILSSLGVKFYNDLNKEFIPVGGTLNNIKTIDITNFKKILNGIDILCLCDVNNKACGLNGASYVYAPQKGADTKMVRMLDNNVKYFCDKVNQLFNNDISIIEGGGAAGAIGAGLYGIVGAKLVHGIKTLLNEINFDNIVKDANYVFTGEGKYDAQSEQGKVISGVMEYTNKYKIPLIIITGSIEKEIPNDLSNSNNIIFSINRKPEDYLESRLHAKDYYKETLLNILKLIKIKKND